jgi:hypothetical protein
MNIFWRQKGIVEWPVILAAIVVLVVVGLVVAAASSGRDVTPPSQVPGAQNACFTSCLGLVELQCGDNELMGACLGVWGCDAGLGVHECR